MVVSLGTNKRTTLTISKSRNRKISRGYWPYTPFTRYDYGAGSLEVPVVNSRIVQTVDIRDRPTGMSVD